MASAGPERDQSEVRLEKPGSWGELMHSVRFELLVWPNF